jgi:hypothetical protein
MTARAWQQLRVNWKIPLTPALLAQRFLAGPLFSTLNWLQAAGTARQRRETSLAGCIVILGYWRSGTTLLHNYLSLDKRFGFASTYACMNPQHFVLTQAAALGRPPTLTRRPMDDLEVSAASPQEDEFALLALGARSPYEALLAPSFLGPALRLADPRDLDESSCRHWCETFEYFLRGVSVVEGQRPLILKSPPHGYRVALLRRLLPEARFVLIVRSPMHVYESAVRMWRALFEMYSLAAIPPEEETRLAVLEDRPSFEAKLTSGLADLPEDRLALIRYESLARNPLETLEALYDRLTLGGFEGVRESVAASVSQRSSYSARNALPPEIWRERLQIQWRSIFERYGYDAE